MPNPDLIIFDCDGVLIDSEVIACRTDSECLAAIGIALSPEQIMDRYVGISAAAMLADIQANHAQPLPHDFAATLARRVAAAFDTQLQPMAGIEATLAALIIRKCVASSSTPDRLRHSLHLTNLLHHFDPHIFSATQVARGKPAPDLFLFAAAHMQTAPNACLVIEDSEAGVRAAVAAGMKVIGFTGGGLCRPGHAERLKDAGATAICDHMHNLTTYLQR